MILSLTQDIEKLLSPVVGDFLAKAKVRAALNMLGIPEAEPDKLIEIADKVELTLVRSLGPVAAGDIGQKIRELSR